MRGLFIAATGQNVGKSTISLGLLSGLKKRFERVGFIKPVGQRHVPVEEGLCVDKDVVLFKEHFGLQIPYADMSPVIIPSGFTRKFIDGEVSSEKLLEKIQNAFARISENHDFTLVEGTGHIGVGSIINLNNAQVAKALGLDILLVCSGGLGSARDELELNFAMCREQGVRVRGVIVNRVLQPKREMIMNYFPRSIEAPVLGCIPYNELLSTPAMHDFTLLFKTALLSGESKRWRHFHHTRLVAGSLGSYREEIRRKQLIITPTSRNEIIEATVDAHYTALTEEGEDFEGGMILTGRRSPDAHLLKKIQATDIPTLYAPIESYLAMEKITSYIAKTSGGDKKKIAAAIKLIETHVDFAHPSCPLCHLVE